MDFTCSLVRLVDSDAPSTLDGINIIDHARQRMLLPDGALWQFRIGADDSGAALALEESLWVDGDGRPHSAQQLVIQGMASRGGGQYSWLLKKMG